MRAIYEDDEGSVWIGTTAGLNKFKDGKFTAYTNWNGVESSGVHSIYKDDDGTLWLGTTGGLSLLKNGKFSNFGKKDGLLSGGDESAARRFPIQSHRRQRRRRLERAGREYEISCPRAILEKVVVFRFNRFGRRRHRFFIISTARQADIAAGIKAVAAGAYFISPPLTTFLFNRSRRTAAFAEMKPGINDLTQTERRVLKLIAEGKISREIADLLFISIRTVERHRQNICDKMEIHGSNALLKFAAAHKKQLV